MFLETRSDASFAEVETRFLQIVGEVLGVDPMPADKHILDVGGDSLSMAIVIDWVAQEFTIEPELDWFFESDNIGDVAQRILETVLAIWGPFRRTDTFRTTFQPSRMAMRLVLSIASISGWVFGGEG